MHCANMILKGCATSAVALAAAFSSSAWAQSDNGIEDIVVTATRQSESVQRVPIAITAISGDTLTKSGINNVQDISRTAPGVQIFPQFRPGEAVFQIRGQIQTDTAPTVDPSVGLYFDDVYVARAPGSLVNLFDVERVEVLKGPQGTLFGKNTTGGAIRIISNKPTSEFEGYAKGSYESFERYTLEGVVNVPMGETLAARVGGQYTRKTDGYSTNLVTGNPIDTDKTWTVRGALKWDPTERLSVLVQGDYTKIDAGGIPSFLRYFIPEAGLFTALNVGLETGNGFNPVAGNTALQNTVRPYGARQVGADLRTTDAASYTFNPATGAYSFNGGTADPTSNVKTWGVSGNVSFDFGFATLKSITAYRKVDALYLYDIDGTQFHILDSNTLTRNKQFSQELILHGNAADDKLDWTVGGLYFWETPFARDRAVPLAGLTYPSRGTDTAADAVNKSWGVFAQGTYKLTDQLSITGGVRYSVEKRGFTASAFNRSANGLPDACVYTVANGLATVPGFQGPCSIEQQGKADGQWSYTASVNYQLASDKLVYARTGRGYRAGGFNSRVNAPEVLGVFKPEIVTDYEVGLKADWINRTLRTNIAVFYSKSSDTQLTINGVSPSNGSAITLVQNIGKRTVKGVEAEIVARPASFLTFDAGLTYLHARLNNPAEPDVNFVQQTPPWTVRVGTTIDTPFSDRFAGALRVDYSFRDKSVDGQAVRNAAGNVIYIGRTRDVGLLSARYTLTDMSNGISLAVYGRNLTNEIYEARAFNIASLGLGLGNVAEPRVVGVELRVPFGAMAKRN